MTEAANETQTETQTAVTTASVTTQSTEETKAEYTAEQQAHIQGLIDKTVSKVNAKSDRKYQEKIASLEAKLSEKPEPADPNIESQKVVEGLQNSLKEVELQRESDKIGYDGERKINALHSAIGGHEVINPEDVVSLLKHKISIDDDGKLFVQGDGGPMVNKNLDPMTVSDFVAEWLSTRPQYLRGSSGGAGSNSSVGSNGVTVDYNNPDTIKNMSDADFKKLIDDGITVDMNGRKVGFKKTVNMFTDKRREYFKRSK